MKHLWSIFAGIFILTSELLKGQISSPSTLSCGTRVSNVSLQVNQQTAVARNQYISRWLRGQINRPQSPIMIPIQAHCVRSTIGTMPACDLLQALDSLNTKYAPANLQFYYCAPPRYINSIYYEMDADFEDSLALPNDVPNVINMYLVNSLSVGGTPICGYTYLPPSVDRIFLTYQCLSLGKTLEHELGHYFNLYHTHGITNFGTTDELVNGSNCTTAGDELCDTPADPNLSGMVDGFCNYFGTAVDANNQPFSPQTTNIMSYTNYQCSRVLTPGQYARINFSALNQRNYLNCISAFVTCQYINTLSAQDSTFDDGSGPSVNYNNNTLCHWKIAPPGVSAIYLEFLNFNLETGKDYLYLYDGGTTASRLVGFYTGNNLPPSFTSSSGQLLLQFFTNSTVTADGWKVHYTSLITGTENGQTDTRTGLRVFPVPATDKIQIMGLEPKVQRMKVINALAQEFELHFDASGSAEIGHLPSGIWTLQVQNSAIHLRFIKY